VAIWEFKRDAVPLRKNLFPLPPGGRVGRHPARIYSRWDMGNGIGQGEGEKRTVIASEAWQSPPLILSLSKDLFIY